MQKCIRTQDIDEVGKTTRHGTFFQMNGNFSFGDYFKEDAIRFAWSLSTNPVADGGFGLDPERIWATVYLDDDEAIGIWHDVIGLPMERIVRRGMDDNFWSMGIPGPCGPCSELYYDRGPDYGMEGGPEVDEDRYMEFWNLVFMQNERGGSTGPGKSDFEILGELPNKNIDTGMGMERMAALLQGVDNLYEIDETRPILDRAAELTGKQYGLHSGHAASESHPDDVRLRVIADHTRTALMLIGDGVTPSNEGRGYVLRRILRRTIRSMRLLGYDDRALPELFPVARDCMSPSYPELATDYERIAMIAYAEEETFRRTLAAGTTILDNVVAETRAAGGSTVAGAQAFQLHDTYGFPIDLTLEMAAEQGLAVDEAGFRRLMAEQRDRAKADSKANKTAHANNPAYRELRAAGATEFLAYERLTSEATIRGVLRDGVAVSGATAGDSVEIVLDRTPFYAESGGQIADEGVIVGVNGAHLRVVDVQRPVKGLIVHHVLVESGEVMVGEEVLAEVDPEWRISARQAHSGTHIVHAALRQVLGPSALQSGSYNKPGYLRLDFAWGSALDPRPARGHRGGVQPGAARRPARRGALHAAGPRPGRSARWRCSARPTTRRSGSSRSAAPWSRELCGGTHVEHSSQVGAITVLGEASVGAGVRRVEAYVGLEALRYLATERALLDRCRDIAEGAQRRGARAGRRAGRAAAVGGEGARAQPGGGGAGPGRRARGRGREEVAGCRLVAVTAPGRASPATTCAALAVDVRGRLDQGTPGGGRRSPPTSTVRRTSSPR